MIKTKTISRPLAVLVVAALLGFLSGSANATIPGAASKSSAPTFNLMAMADVISTSDGDSMWMWGYGCSDVTCTKNLINKYQMQFPGPTLIVNQGDRVTINLRNRLPLPVSIVFPGQTVTASGGGQIGLLTREAAAANPGATTDSVTYKFTASRPGTYIYYSGTRSDLEVEMGMVGTIIVRPTGYADTTCPANATYTTSCRKAYEDPLSAYNQEYLFLLSEADPLIHQKVAFASSGTLAQIQSRLALIDMTKRHPTDWFMNGRNFPDLMSDPNDPGNGIFPTQPYNCMPMTHPGEKVLMRIVSAGLDFHPLHTHGQNHLVIARDGRLLSTTPDSVSPPPVPDLAVSDFTTSSVPGETVDAIWGPWTGAKLGWDIYGTADINPHTCCGLSTPSDCVDPVTHEYCIDHYKPIPVSLPSDSNITVGVAGAGMWSGSPYMGMTANLPPAVTAQNPMGGYTYMWHSHDERELTTNNIFPGGMGTMAMVVPVGMPLP